MSYDRNRRIRECIAQTIQRVKFVRISDILSIFPMFLGLMLSFPFRLLYQHIWLICEREDEARDNGYWFFKYLNEKHPEILSIYAIKKKSIDYKKVESLGKVVQFGSVAHWIYYFAAERNISSQKEGKPNAALCFILEVYLGMRKNRAYIRHGIVKDNQRWVYYDVTKMNLFVCAAKREYDFVRQYFGYPEKNVQLLGLCRYDNLSRPHIDRRQLLVMPTMREWLRVISKDTRAYENSDSFLVSEYFIKWNSLINNNKLHSLLDDHNINLVFFLHASMQKYYCYFKSNNKHIIIASYRNYDVQQLLKESSFLLTDYSSVFFDFAYMKKPLVYYQFDYEKYRIGQYQEGYFSYTEDGFGPVVFNENDLMSEIEKIINNGMCMSAIFRERVDSFFAYNDDRNCERTFQAIFEMK
jgi:CDP-glycerol glycerophosphotransferase (TagB/SpsB family)